MALEVYAGLLLHKAGKEINESNLKEVLKAAGAHVDDAKLKALVASLHGVNIDDAIKQAAIAPVAAAPHAAGEKKAEKKPEEEKKSTEEAAAGLGALFG